MNTEIYSYTKERIEELTRSAELYGSVALSKDQMKDIGSLAIEAIENKVKESKALVELLSKSSQEYHEGEHCSPEELKERLKNSANTKKFWDNIRVYGKPKTIDEAFTTLIRAGILNEDGSLSSNYYDVKE